MITNINEQVAWVRDTKPYITPPGLIGLIRKKYPKDAVTPTTTPPMANGNGSTNGSMIQPPEPLPPSSIPTPDLPPPTAPPSIANKKNIPSSFTFSSSSSAASSKPPSRQVQSVLPLRKVPANEMRARRLGATSQSESNSSSAEQPAVVTTQYIDLTLSPVKGSTSPIVTTRRAPPVIPSETSPEQPLLSPSDVTTYQKLFHLQESKIKLLEQKIQTSESTLISMDDKKAIYNTLEKQIKSLEREMATTKVEIDSPPAVEPPSIPSTPVFRTPIAPPRRLAEARQIVANTANAAPNDSDDEIEDHFGSGELSGLLTPTQVRGRRSDGEIDNGSDLESFIDDSFEESVSESDTYEDTNDVVDELFDIRLSQETADKMNIRYGSQLPTRIPHYVSPTRRTPNTRSRTIPTIEEIDSGSDVDMEPVKEDDDDEIEDVGEIDFPNNDVADPIEIDDEEDEPEIMVDDYMTQLNQEREIVDYIELSDDDDDDDLSLEKALAAPPPPKEPPTSKNSIPDGEEVIEISDSEGFSDDDDLVDYFGGKRRLPGSEAFIDEVYKVLGDTFKLKTFRANQLEAVTATLQGKDVFVLMPTGGGKSLCYQLPALVKSGKTSGTTVVISPLISLMQDQVQHLKAMGIKAGMISAQGAKGDNKHTTNLFREGFLDIVYLSPEKANRSGHTQKIIARLYKNDQLARVVIDEAHCLSSWGHDFRPDYQGLRFFKEQFPDTPIMALTATANEKVREDILHNLGMEDPVYLKQSFNRTNLFYEIKPKHRDFLREIKDYIMDKYKNQTGIIYCHSKQSCEQTSAKLNEYGLRTSFYHAGMNAQDRYTVQTKWQENQIQVICATIAFGMGIDKPDVRFVVHLFLPRSLEGYYQETGRAGRDGQQSECIMYYTARDARTLRTLIQGDELFSEDVKESHLEKMRQVVQYCENTTDCRRQQVLQYFNESFNPADCNKQCDNCLNFNQGEVVEKDCTEYARDIINLVKSVQNDKVTVLHCQDVFRGLKHKKIVTLHHDENEYHGKGKQLDRNLVERIFFHLINEGYLVEYIVRMKKSKFGTTYVKVGRNDNLQDKKVIIKFIVKPKPPAGGKKYAPKDKPTPAPKSTSGVSPYFGHTPAKNSTQGSKKGSTTRKRTSSQRSQRSQRSQGGAKRRKTTSRKPSQSSNRSRKATSAMPL
ncbi:ATP-dependent helicase SGS1 [Candida viswanathii]|uniref:DNA 3'-5' helicase n=1 Tax=Candida viswanathii TaxID=5486 RepID=A0A367XQ65_9ASCO|nr:ATP-dependent helicase SGS1 [Candida viswanathii]